MELDRIKEISKRIFKILSDSNCTVREAENILNGLRKTIYDETVCR